MKVVLQNKKYLSYNERQHCPFERQWKDQSECANVNTATNNKINDEDAITDDSSDRSSSDYFDLPQNIKCVSDPQEPSPQKLLDSKFCVARRLKFCRGKVQEQVKRGEAKNHSRPSYETVARERLRRKWVNKVSPFRDSHGIDVHGLPSDDACEANENRVLCGTVWIRSPGSEQAHLELNVWTPSASCRPRKTQLHNWTS